MAEMISVKEGLVARVMRDDWIALNEGSRRRRMRSSTSSFLGGQEMAVSWREMDWTSSTKIEMGWLES